jgi:hypothetical protein
MLNTPRSIPETRAPEPAFPVNCQLSTVNYSSPIINPFPGLPLRFPTCQIICTIILATCRRATCPPVHPTARPIFWLPEFAHDRLLSRSIVSWSTAPVSRLAPRAVPTRQIMRAIARWQRRPAAEPAGRTALPPWHGPRWPELVHEQLVHLSTRPPIRRQSGQSADRCPASCPSSLRGGRLFQPAKLCASCPSSSRPITIRGRPIKRPNSATVRQNMRTTGIPARLRALFGCSLFPVNCSLCDWKAQPRRRPCGEY